MNNIKEAAVLKDGIIYTGKNHATAFNKMRALGVRCNKPHIQGFVTESGTFVDRAEAAKIAYECGQILKPTDLLMSEDLRGLNL